MIIFSQRMSKDKSHTWVHIPSLFSRGCHAALSRDDIISGYGVYCFLRSEFNICFPILDLSRVGLRDRGSKQLEAS